MHSPLTGCGPAAAFLRSCFCNFAVTVEGFTTISVNRAATHTGLPKNQLPESSVCEAELSSVQMGWLWCQAWLTGMSMTWVLKWSWAYVRVPLLVWSG